MIEYKWEKLTGKRLLLTDRITRTRAAAAAKSFTTPITTPVTPARRLT